ncbi:hypothetical protein SOASR030_37510 [Leminorella grimontii]|uniref:Uncharacterized protein n=1 Tax=Leminorella grimontii TaxID=82981 RepID=A0AAV5N7B0_9GAMM|nr:hypothetical protein [Leminorella grimontii]KFC92472.1 hypothetical protein GLGR_3802 [Leminorella grimontii ATCC 33999 = DSM 5078]GKX57639.1 hypothetical protein SOASR030_37510 [Leminorella grimontii]VFS54604.1 Uncharacterised protein [Leminorella grimontii]VFS55873.1 Uncharacterised protein [Leminorella grimontii]
MNAQKFNQRYSVGTIFVCLFSNGERLVKSVAPATDAQNGAYVKVDKNPWFLPVSALDSVTERLKRELRQGHLSIYGEAEVRKHLAAGDESSLAAAIEGLSRGVISSTYS